jgi:hypothetical protein
MLAEHNVRFHQILDQFPLRRFFGQDALAGRLIEVFHGFLSAKIQLFTSISAHPT